MKFRKHSVAFACLLFVAACASYSGKELPEYSFAQIPMREHRPTVEVAARFSAYGRENAAGARFFRTETDRVFSESKVFSDIGAAGAKHRITLRLSVKGDAFRFSLASIVSGLSLAVIPTYSSEEYVLQAEVSEGKTTLKKYEYRDRVETWVQLFLVVLAPWRRPGETTAKVVDNMLLNFLHDLQRDGILVEKPASAFTDTVVLKDGTQFEKVKTAMTADSIVIVTEDGKTLVYKRDQIQSILKK